MFRYCNTSWKQKLRRIDNFLVWFLVTSRATQEYMDKVQPREVWEREVLSDVTLTVESRIYLAENA